MDRRPAGGVPEWWRSWRVQRRRSPDPPAAYRYNPYG